jgi:BirA family biotin operon repressor/biotin-[acetyl-CoA-carboxylase] ligase
LAIRTFENTAVCLVVVVGHDGTGRFNDVRWVDETGSTNADLLELARQGAPEGIVLAADHQTAGRGRQSRSWVAPPGSSLLVSVLLRPDSSEVNRCTMSLAVAAAEAVDAVAGFAPRLKWPNDLVWPGDGSAPDRKLAGILAEVDWSGADSGPAVIAGIGLNCNWPDDVPDELVDVMVSVNHVTGRAVDRQQLLHELATRLDRWYGNDNVVEQWRARSATLGRRVRVDLLSETVDGVAVELGPEGHLIVQRDDGQTREIAVGDVVHLRDL